MGWNPFKKKDNVVDLSSMEKSGLMARSREIERIKKIEGAKSGQVLDLTKLNMDNASSVSSDSSSALGFLGSFAEAASSQSSSLSLQTVSPSLSSMSSLEDGKSKIAKRILGMTEKLEAQDKEIYSLQQRIELLETKIKRLEGK